MSNLEAGREMDALVAEKVFGCDPLNARVGLHKNGDLEYYWGYPVGHDIAPAYSTDISDAWRVIEHMQSLGWSWEVLNTTKTAFGAVFSMSQDDVYGTDAETVPLAICKAALKAIGVSES